MKYGIWKNKISFQKLSIDEKGREIWTKNTDKVTCESNSVTWIISLFISPWRIFFWWLSPDCHVTSFVAWVTPKNTKWRLTQGIQQGHLPLQSLIQVKMLLCCKNKMIEMKIWDHHLHSSQVSGFITIISSFHPFERKLRMVEPHSCLFSKRITKYFLFRSLGIKL